jgi:uncharacterized membrane protein YhaH (DUF805 family)
MGNPFSMQGRISRRQYFLASLIVVAVTYAFAFAIGFASGVSGGNAQNAGVLGGIVGIAGCIVQAFLAVRRLHDLGKPGWHYWLFFIPFYNIYLGLVLVFAKGSTAANEYGPAPA